jgi:polysaccharide deacetylase family sporulation protein PdaB
MGIPAQTKKARLNLTLAAALVLILATLAWQQGLPVKERNLSQPAMATGTLSPIYKASITEKVIALTFDISWGEKTPPLVLDELKKYGLKATFFLSGPWAKNHPDLVQRIIAEGHEIQSHGHAHVNYSQLSREEAAENIQKAHAILKGYTGKEPRYIRPPNGDFNDQSLQTALDLGYQTATWSLDSRDWMNPGVEAIEKRVLDRIQPGDIVLLHASDTARQTNLALPRIIESLRGKGYKMVTLSELLRPNSKGR